MTVARSIDDVMRVIKQCFDALLSDSNRVTLVSRDGHEERTQHHDERRRERQVEYALYRRVCDGQARLPCVAGLG